MASLLRTWRRPKSATRSAWPCTLTPANKKAPPLLFDDASLTYFSNPEAIMNKRIVVAFLLLFGAIFTLGGTQSSPSPRASAQEKPSLAARPSALLDCSFISPLDSCIQDR